MHFYKLTVLEIVLDGENVTINNYTYSSSQL